MLAIAGDAGANDTSFANSSHRHRSTVSGQFEVGNIAFLKAWQRAFSRSQLNDSSSATHALLQGRTQFVHAMQNHETIARHVLPTQFRGLDARDTESRNLGIQRRDEGRSDLAGDTSSASASAPANRLFTSSSSTYFDSTPPSGGSIPAVHTIAFKINLRYESFCQLEKKCPIDVANPRPLSFR